jgi:hypothetical protein
VKLVAVRTCLLTAAMLMISFFIVLFQGKWTVLSFINVTFLLSLLPLAIGGFLFVYEQGFFNGFVYGFRRLRKSGSKAERYLAELQGIADEPPVQPRKFTITYPLLLSSLILFLFMIAAGYAIR